MEGVDTIILPSLIGVCSMAFVLYTGFVSGLALGIALVATANLARCT